MTNKAIEVIEYCMSVLHGVLFFCILCDVFAKCIMHNEKT